MKKQSSRSEQGAALIECALALALVVIISISSMEYVGEEIEEMFREDISDSDGLYIRRPDGTSSQSFLSNGGMSGFNLRPACSGGAGGGTLGCGGSMGGGGGGGI